MARKYLQSRAGMLVCLAAFLFVSPALAAEPTTLDAEGQVALADDSAVGTRGFSGVLCVAEGGKLEVPLPDVERVVVGAPNLLGVDRSSSGLNLTGKQAGTTVVAVWTGSGRSSYQVRVTGGDNAVGALGVEPDPFAGPLPITLEPGASELLRGDHITRTAVSDPEVADVVTVSDGEVLLNAKKPGLATVRIWEDRGLATYIVTVEKRGLPIGEAASAIADEIGCPSITVRAGGEAVILSGSAPSADVMQKAVAVAEATGKKVVNLVTVESISPESVIASLRAAMPDEPLTYEVLPDQSVLVRGALASLGEVRKVQDIVQAWLAPAEAKSPGQQQPSLFGPQEPTADAVERNRVQAREQEPGDVVVNDEFTFARRVFSGQVPGGPRIVAVIDVNPAIGKQILVCAQVLEVDRGKLKEAGLEWASFVAGIAQPLTNVFEDRISIPLDEGGPWRRTPLSAEVKLLIDENAARILSEPKVLIADGRTANILVGGEFPIPVAQTASLGSQTITVEFKTFGIQLAVRPRIVPDGRILLTLTPEVSRLDYTNAVKTADFEIPAIATRRATTTVHVANGQSLAIGGLLTSEDRKLVTRVPFLSKIPIIGELFKSKRFERNETELIILVTPTVVENDQEVPIPPVEG